MRQLDLIDPSVAKDLEITVIGAGGIGSWTALCLAKTGFKNVTVFDFDELEEHNLSNQAYSTAQVGEKKVDALNQVLTSFGEEEYTIRDKKFEGDDSLGKVVILAVDSIKAREEIFDSVLRSSNTQYMIDGRMGLTTMHLYSIDLIEDESIQYYRDSLDPDVLEVPCTAQTTMSTALMIAGMIVSRVVNHINQDGNQLHEIYDTRTQHQVKLS